MISFLELVNGILKRSAGQVTFGSGMLRRRRGTSVMACFDIVTLNKFVDRWSGSACQRS